MKLIRDLFIELIIIAAAFSIASAQTRGSSPGMPALKGTTVSGIIECGEGYTSHELYDMRITLLDVFRGGEAWKRIKEADRSNQPAAPGTDYILARVKFEYFARGTPGTCVYELAPEEFTAYSAGGDEYPEGAVVPPKPSMKKALRSGDTAEGWLVFAVAEGDAAPLMSFAAADSGGAVQHGESKWFLLR